VDLSWEKGALAECRFGTDRDGKWNIRLAEASLSIDLKAGRSKTLRLRDGKLVAA
jgi:hypothetical protein